MDYKKQLLSLNGKRLRAIKILVPCLLFLPLLLLNLAIILKWVDLPLLPFLLLLLWPILNIFTCLAFSGGLKKGELTNKLVVIKYVPFFPLVFYNDSNARFSRFKNASVIKGLLKKGDVILRRHDNYIDGLVLGQTTYFTHAAIYYGDCDNKTQQIFHATGKEGVAACDFDEFFRCDDIAILRFDDSQQHRAKTFPGTYKPNWFREILGKGDHLRNIENLVIDLPFIEKNISPSTFDSNDSTTTNIPPGRALDNPVFIKDIRTLFQPHSGKKLSTEHQVLDKAILAEELEIYDALFANYEAKGEKHPIDLDHCIDVVLKRAKLEVKLNSPYDYDFNFVDFKTLSCVEFVWYCYKCLFPLHLIRRRCSTYFSKVKVFILCPDLFLRSPFFNLVYTSVDESLNKLTLRKNLKNRFIKFWQVIALFIGWQVLISTLIILFLKIF